MYTRKENIEEENLDWSEHHEPKDAEKEVTRHVIHPDSEENKTTFINNVQSNRKLNLKKSIIRFSTEYTGISLILSILFLPYIVGFLISYFLFYFYGGMSIGSFMNIQGNLYMGFWSIGAYLFITAGVIWAVLLSTKSS